MKNRKKLKIIFSILLILFKIFFLIPVHKTGGIANVDKFAWINILEYNFNNVSCADCFYYEILWSNLIFELFVLILVLIMINFIFKEKIKLKKRIKRIIIMLLILIVLFFPIKIKYWDGGTTEYRALTYKIIKWNRIKNYGRIKNGTEIIVFPNNFYELDYYDEEIEPPIVSITLKGEISKTIICNQATYHWSKKVGNKTLSVISDTIDPINFTYKDKFIIKNSEKVYLDNINDIREITIKNLDDLENNYQINFNEKEKSFSFESLKEGEYIVVFKYTKENDYAYYSYKIEIVKE